VSWIVKLFRHRMLVVIVSIAFFLGFTAGFSFSAIYPFQKNTQIAGILPIVTLVLSSSGFLGLFRQIIREKHQEESIPRLEFENIRHDNGIYYIAVKKNEKAVGEIKDAKGFITVEGTNIENTATVWNNNQTEYNVSIVAELRLLGIKDEKNIVFYSPNPYDDGIIGESEPKPYDDYCKKLVVKIGSSNAPTFTYTTKISSIVNK
jgi:hypothetical protein